MLKQLLKILGKSVGIHFSPDNHVAPIFRLGRYHRTAGPGFFWLIPLVDQPLDPIKTSIYVGNFLFDEVLSKDNIPFRIRMTVLFVFDPDSALKSAAAQLVQGGEQLLEIIVRDFANRRVRRLVAHFNAEKLADSQVIHRIEEAMVRYLRQEMELLGLKPIKAKDGGVMIKEVTAPEIFKRTMLDVRHNEAILEVLRGYPMPELVQLHNQVLFANSFKDRSGNLAVMMGAPEGMHMLPLVNHNGKPPNGKNL